MVLFSLSLSPPYVKKIVLKIEVEISSPENSKGSLLTLHIMGDVLLSACEDLPFCAININKRCCLCINVQILKWKCSAKAGFEKMHS